MRRLIAEKVAFAALALAFVLTLNFFLFRALGDPRTDLLRVPHMPAAERTHLIHERGLDGSLLHQYGIYVRNTLSGQLETSYHTGRPVSHMIADALPNTLILALPATLLAALLAAWIGVLSARRRGSAADGVLTGASLTLYSMPEQFLAIAAVLVFSIWLRPSPVSSPRSPAPRQPGSATSGTSPSTPFCPCSRSPPASSPAGA